MRILIVSDTHRQNNNYLKVLERVKPVDMVIHCGDVEGRDGECNIEGRGQIQGRGYRDVRAYAQTGYRYFRRFDRGQSGESDLSETGGKAAVLHFDGIG